jgi:hypothetical protein
MTERSTDNIPPQETEVLIETSVTEQTATPETSPAIKDDPNLRVLKAEYAIWGLGGGRIHRWGHE